MIVCVETDCLIALIRKDKDALKKLGNLIAEGEKITTAPINASELFNGAYLSEKVDENLIACVALASSEIVITRNIKHKKYQAL